MTKIYGIKNCDTMKKAFKWLDENGADYSFHDYKKDGLDEAAFTAAIKTHGWEKVINTRGTTWRKLPEDMRENMNEADALAAAKDNPSLVKRPLLIANENILLGFKAEDYEALFKA